MRFVAFDLETATLTPDNEDPHKYRPLGICCAATQLVDTDLGKLGIQQPIAWANWSDGSPDPDTAMYGAKMSADQVRGMVEYLHYKTAEGWIPLTWNGLSFDFDILAEESMSDEHQVSCVNIARKHYDMAFQMLADKGFMVGMQAAAKGMGLAGKNKLKSDDGYEGHGDVAPILWAKSRADQDKVLSYVKQDVQTTSEIALEILDKKVLRWTSKAGKPRTWEVKKLLTVQEALKLPMPDTSWMSTPRTRESCYAWTKQYIKE